MLKGGLTFISPSEVPAVEADAAETGYRIFKISTSPYEDASALFEAVREALPLVPPIKRNDRWDALLDSLREGLNNLTENRVAIIWEGSANLRIYDPEGYSNAVSILTYAIEDLSNPEYADGGIMEVYCYVA